MRVFFWKTGRQYGEKQCLSQWFSCVFYCDSLKFTSAEQWMMYRKALLFATGDHKEFNIQIAENILKTSDPMRIKLLGRNVRGFNERTWNKDKYDIVYRGNLLKFSQNSKLRQYLLSLKGQELIEASPTDRIWGIGFSENDALAHENEWGQNLLGKCLMDVCKSL